MRSTEDALAQLCPANAIQLDLDSFTAKACKSQQSELSPSKSLPKSTKKKNYSGLILEDNQVTQTGLKQHVLPNTLTENGKKVI